MIKHKAVALVAAWGILLLARLVGAEAFFRVVDYPGDDGKSVKAEFSISDAIERFGASRAQLLRATSRDGEFTLVAATSLVNKQAVCGGTPQAITKPELVDYTNLGNPYFYKLRLLDDKGTLVWESEPVGPVSGVANWFATRRLAIFILGLLLSIAIVYYIQAAKRGKKLWIRRIAGLDAIDDAVGRATEMGREVVFVPGIMDMDDPQTIAGLTILSRVAEKTAEYKTPLKVLCARSMVMVAAREIVKEAYMNIGRSDAYKDDMVRYLTDDQFGFAAGVDGYLVRERPATVFFQGTFYAESLILAETGYSVGAIQIAGTAMPSQLPFFITACDYTLIGEELFAASAYLSEEPRLLGSLKGQDAGKLVIILFLITGAILETLGIHWFTQLFAGW